MNFDFNKLNLITFSSLLIIILAIMSPSILLIFMFGKSFFIESDTLKIIILGMSFSTPIWLLNTLLAAVKKSDHVPNENIPISAMIGGFICIILLSIPSLIKLYFNINLQEAVGLILSFQTLIFIWFKFSKQH